MSGAELIAVLGVISSVIAIVDRTKQLYDAASNAQGLPEAFHEVADRLPIVSNILNLAEEGVQQNDGDKSHKEVKDVVGACGEKAKKPETIPARLPPRKTLRELDDVNLRLKLYVKETRLNY